MLESENRIKKKYCYPDGLELFQLNDQKKKNARTCNCIAGFFKEQIWTILGHLSSVYDLAVTSFIFSFPSELSHLNLLMTPLFISQNQNLIFLLQRCKHIKLSKHLKTINLIFLYHLAFVILSFFYS